MKRTVPFIIHEKDREFEGCGEPGSRKVRWRNLISGDRTPTDSLTVGLAELESGDPQGLALHKHLQAEVYYILSGEGVITIAGRDHVVRPGYVVFIPGGVEHGARNTGTELFRLFYAFAADSIIEVRYEFKGH